MKKMRLILWVPLALFLACSNDDDQPPAQEPEPENILHFGGNEYELNTDGSYVSDFGTVELGDTTFYRYVFTLSDGTGHNHAGPADASIAVFLELFSLSEDEFTTGDYPFSGEESPEANFLSGNSMLILLEEEDTLWVHDGQVSVSKSGNAWVIEYELTLDDEEAAEGEFEGVLDLVDETE